MKRFLTGVLALGATLALGHAQTLEWDGTRQSVHSLHFQAEDKPYYKGDVREAVLRFLEDNRGLFNGSSLLESKSSQDPNFEAMRRDVGEAPEVEITRVDSDEQVEFVRLKQTFQGLEVAGGDMVVSRKTDGQITSVQGGYVAAPHDGRFFFSQGADIGQGTAEDTAKKALNAEALGDYQKTKMVWWTDANGELVKAYQVDLRAHKPLGDWRIFVATHSGEVLEKTNMMLFHSGDVERHLEGSDPQKPTKPKPKAKAKVYMSNPLRDSNLVEVNLENLDGSGKLIGSAVKVTNGKADEIHASSGDFTVATTSTHFGEVMAYFHLDRIHSELKHIDPQFTGMDWQIPMEVHSKGNFWTRNDNAFYSPFSKSMAILDPQKLNDLHLEAAVSYHEYHHAVTDAIIPGLRQNEGKALHEGYSDYFACALTQDAKIGEWALQPINRPHMRDLTSQRKYPEDLHPRREPHSDGEIWAAACWDLRQKLDDHKADFLVHKSRFYLSSNGTFKAAYQGILQADQDYFQGKNKKVIQAVFKARGIDKNTVEFHSGEEMDGEDVLRRAGFKKLHR